MPFVTIDPPGSRDLDQAFHAERDAGAAFACTTRSPMSPRSSRRVARSTANRSLAASRSTCPTAGHRCCPRCSGEGAASLLPDQDRPALCGRSTSTRPARRTVGAARARDDPEPRHARLRRRAAARSTPAAPRNRSRCCARSERSGVAPRSRRAAASASISPRRRSTPDRRRLHARVRAPLPVERGTRRSRCSPEWKPREAHDRRADRHLAHVASAPSRRRSIGCGAVPAHSASAGPKASSWAEVVSRLDRSRQPDGPRSSFRPPTCCAVPATRCSTRANTQDAAAVPDPRRRRRAVRARHRAARDGSPTATRTRSSSRTAPGRAARLGDRRVSTRW